MSLPQPVVYRVKLSCEDVARIKGDYPDKAALFESLLHRQGEMYNLRLDEATAASLLNNFGEALHDQLFARAYALKEEKYFSYLLQLREILRLPKSRVSSVLEIGPGYNILRSLLECHGYAVSTMDVKPEHAPTILGDILQPPPGVGRYDMVCAFEVLQHLPHRHFRQALENMRSCSRRYVFLSLPCPMNHLYLQFRFELVHRVFRRLSCGWRWLLPLPFRAADRDEKAFLERPDKHNPHYWEVNRRSYPKCGVLRDIEESGIRVVKQFHNPLHPYHWFVLGEVR